MKKLLIMEKNNILEVAKYDFGELTNYKVFSTISSSLVGNIYLGRITKIVKGSFAFVDIGEEKSGFLDIMDFKEKHLYKNKKLIIKETDLILVQVVKDGTNIKGPTLTTEINISTKNLVLLKKPNKSVGFSKKIVDLDKKEILKNLTKEFDYSVIFRSESEQSLVDIIKKDYLELKQELDNIIRLSEFEPKIKLLKSTNSIRNAIMDMAYTSDIIITQNKDIFDKLKSLNLDIEIKLIEVIDLFSHEMMLSKIQEFYKKKIWLKSGGFIIIEETEACIVVDVNSGKNSNSKNKSSMITKTNTEAVFEILHQVKFRNLSGIILIDFIDMDKKEDKEVIYNKMVEISKNDFQPINIFGFTKLGLLELTRKRNNLSISKIPNNYRVRSVIENE